MDLSTGEIILEIGAGLQVFGFVGVPFDLLALDRETFVDLTGPPFPGPTIGLPPGVSTEEIEGNGFGAFEPGFFPTGVFNLGAVIPEDFRSEVALADPIFSFDGSGNLDPANAINASQNITFIPATIPEPGSLSLLALAGLGAVARRRR